MPSRGGVARLTAHSSCYCCAADGVALSYSLGSVALGSADQADGWWAWWLRVEALSLGSCGDPGLVLRLTTAFGRCAGPAGTIAGTVVPRCSKLDLVRLWCVRSHPRPLRPELPAVRLLRFAGLVSRGAGGWWRPTTVKAVAVLRCCTAGSRVEMTVERGALIQLLADGAEVTPRLMPHCWTVVPSWSGTGRPLLNRSPLSGATSSVLPVVRKSGEPITPSKEAL
ncbi:hypothetical protein FBY35_2469 [Streptomyces sp. SLBN-118]|nr:hypothetical protein FBY35_2469 [Streptomyces sp. SLBN-118]